MYEAGYTNQYRLFSFISKSELYWHQQLFELVCITPGSHQCPQDREDSGSSQDKQPPQSLWVVCLHNLNDPQQCLDPRSPQVTHVQSLKIDQTCPTTTEVEERGLVCR